jgi:hypothetical protein
LVNPGFLQVNASIYNSEAVKFQRNACKRFHFALLPIGVGICHRLPRPIGKNLKQERLQAFFGTFTASLW